MGLGGARTELMRATETTHGHWGASYGRHGGDVIVVVSVGGLIVKDLRLGTHRGMAGVHGIVSAIAIERRSRLLGRGWVMVTERLADGCWVRLVPD